MKTKFCSDCICWIYKESVAGIGYGICENEDSEYKNMTTPEDENCPEFEENEEESYDD